MEAEIPQVNEETPIAQSPQALQVRVTKNPRKVAASRRGALARKAELIHNSNTEYSPIKTWTPYAIGIIAVVWLFLRPEKRKKPPPVEVQSELSPHVML